MNLQELKSLALELSARPIQGKRLFVFTGTIEELNNHLNDEDIVGISKHLDLNQLLIDENITLESEDAIKKALRRALKTTLEQYYRELKGQQILVVTSPELLARYRIELTPFYEYYVSDRTMVIIVSPRIKISTRTQRLKNFYYIEIDENSCINYLKKIVGEENFIGGETYDSS
jgi:hypothetical protein